MTNNEVKVKKRMLVLMSSCPFDRKQITDQSRAIMLLQAKGVNFECIDGSDPATKERRNELFLISGIRGCYPQFFFVQPDGTTTYFGNWDKLEAINEASSLPDEILEANPQIMTWDQLFGEME